MARYIVARRCLAAYRGVVCCVVAWCGLLRSAIVLVCDDVCWRVLVVVRCGVAWSGAALRVVLCCVALRCTVLCGCVLLVCVVVISVVV